MEASVEQYKQRARKTWAAGNFDEIAKVSQGVGLKVADKAAIRQGVTLLDVACGTGNATIPAAVAGAQCTGLDLTPELLEHARRHAAESSVEIEWIEGDAEALPFEDNSFERVVSTFGVMFAPRHEVAAGELARVCAPGGRVVLASWTPEGMIGDMFKTMGSKLPPPPAFAGPPILWGDEDYVRGLLEPHGFELRFERAMAIFPGDSVEAVVARMEKYFGPWRMAQAALGDEWPALRAQLYDLYDSAAEPVAEGSIAAFGEYLLLTATKNS